MSIIEPDKFLFVVLFHDLEVSELWKEPAKDSPLCMLTNFSQEQSVVPSLTCILLALEYFVVDPFIDELDFFFEHL